MHDCYYKRDKGIGNFKEWDLGNNHLKRNENRNVR